jgi:hypothetical protein
VLDLELFLVHSPFSPLGLSYITMPGIFPFCWFFKVPVELSMHWFSLEFFYLFASNNNNNNNNNNSNSNNDDNNRQTKQVPRTGE